VSQSVVIALDQGSSTSRALAIDSKGKVVLKIPETPDSPAALDWTDPKVKQFIDSLL